MAKTTLKKTVTAANIEKLGAQRLAALLIELAERQPNLKRRLRAELAAEIGAGDLAFEIDKRLDALAASRARISWRKRPELVADLDVQRRLIAERLGDKDVQLALPRLLALLHLAEPLSHRAHDPKGELEAVFQAAAGDLGRLLPQSNQLPMQLARTLADAVLTEPRGRWSEWMRGVLPGLAPPVAAEMLAIMENQGHLWTPKLSWVARLLADAAGDVDAFIRAVPDALRKTPAAGAEIARRLLAASRAEEALAALAQSDPRGAPGRSLFGRDPAPATDFEWDSVHIEALEATGHATDAQAARWASFEQTLSAERLRDIVKRLPDFDDVEAVDRAVALALDHRDANAALRFLMEWPALPEASRLVVARHGEIRFRAETPIWAERLENRYQLAALLLLRLVAVEALHDRNGDLSAIEAELDDVRSLGQTIADFGGAPTPDEFQRELLRRRRR